MPSQFPLYFMSSCMLQLINSEICYSFFPSDASFKICCSGMKAPCGPKSLWVPAAMVNWGQSSVQLSTGSCPHPSEVAAVRYAWRDWPCAFKACPVYSATGSLPAPPFIISPYAGQENVWKIQTKT